MYPRCKILVLWAYKTSIYLKQQSKKIYNLITTSVYYKYNILVSCPRCSPEVIRGRMYEGRGAFLRDLAVVKSQTKSQFTRYSSVWWRPGQCPRVPKHHNMWHERPSTSGAVLAAGLTKPEPRPYVGSGQNRFCKNPTVVSRQIWLSWILDQIMSTIDKWAHVESVC